MAVAENATKAPITIHLGTSVTEQLRGLRREEAAGDSPWRSLLGRADVPDEVLRELLDAGLFIDELAHRSGPRWLLERLADEFKYPEAILTLIKLAYTDCHGSAAQFEITLNRFRQDRPWIMESLAYTAPSSEEKRTIYLSFLGAEQEGLRRISDATAAEARAATASDPSELQKLFETGEPRVLRALADNPSTPHALLEMLSDLRDKPLSNVIRNLATINLKSRGHGTD